MNESIEDRSRILKIVLEELPKNKPKIINALTSFESVILISFRKEKKIIILFIFLKKKQILECVSFGIDMFRVDFPQKRAHEGIALLINFKPNVRKEM